LKEVELKQKKSQVSRSFSLFTFILILVFLGLGTWQLQRKTEKEALLDFLVQSQKNPALNVDDIKTPTLFQPLYTTGHFVPNQTIFLQSKVHQGKNGVYVLNVFRTQKGHYLLIQRGWAIKEILNTPQGNIRIEGIARVPSSPTYFQPVNSSPTYFWIDLKALSEDLNLPLLPYYLVAKASEDPQILPTPPIPLPPNNHFGYAFTWYSLAFALGLMLLWSRVYYLKKEKL
jgi:surfeit locus 1 family protein